jgi:hypothetical protein
MSSQADPSDVDDLLQQLADVYTEALDYLDHADLEEFVAAESTAREAWLEQVDAIRATRQRPGAFHKKFVL